MDGASRETEQFGGSSEAEPGQRCPLFAPLAPRRRPAGSRLPPLRLTYARRRDTIFNERSVNFPEPHFLRQLRTIGLLGLAAADRELHPNHFFATEHTRVQCGSVTTVAGWR